MACPRKSADAALTLPELQAYLRDPRQETRERLIVYAFANRDEYELLRPPFVPAMHGVALAFEAGLRQLWREGILGRSLRGELPPDEAIDTVKIDFVELAEQHAAM